MNIVTREEVIQFIKDWANAHPGKDNVIKNALGSNGSSWHSDYKDGIISQVDALVRTINDKTGPKIEEEVNKRINLRNKLNSQWQTAIEGNFNNIKTVLSQLGKTVTITNLDNLPE